MDEIWYHNLLYVLDRNALVIWIDLERIYANHIISHPEKFFFLMWQVQKILAKANKLGIKSIFLSSEAVFDGRKGMYTEEDIPNPITLYGKQKLQIENLNDYLIFRISRATGSSFGEKDIFDEFYNKII